MKERRNENAAVGVDATVDERGTTSEEDTAALDGSFAFDGENGGDSNEKEGEKKIQKDVVLLETGLDEIPILCNGIVLK